MVSTEAAARTATLPVSPNSISAICRSASALNSVSEGGATKFGLVSILPIDTFELVGRSVPKTLTAILSATDGAGPLWRLTYSSSARKSGSESCGGRVKSVGGADCRNGAVTKLRAVVNTLVGCSTSGIGEAET